LKFISFETAGGVDALSAFPYTQFLDPRGVFLQLSFA